MALIIEEKIIIKLVSLKDWRIQINVIKLLVNIEKADVLEYINLDRKILIIIISLLAKPVIKDYKTDIVRLSDLDAAL